MSRILLLLLFVVWITWRESYTGVSDPFFWPALVMFLGVFALLVLSMGLWSRILARHLTAGNAQRSLNRFGRTMFASRLAIPLWLGAGLYALGWGDLVLQILGPLDAGDIQTPGAILGTLPALLAWAGLWWSQYPADRALREQNVLARLDCDLPVYAPPPFVSYFLSNLRLQLLFTVVPVLLLLLAHDLVAAAVMRPLNLSAEKSPVVALGLLLLASGVIYLVAPEILRHVLHTQPLAPGALRSRLEALCRRHNLRYRDILLWRTEGSLGNAAVMGVVPRFRYILMSDLLLETMSDAQIEAVFAHELGHVVHRHMWWYLLFVAIFLFALAGPGDWIAGQLRLPWLGGAALELLLTALAVAAFVLAFGYVSRRFERQADVFAARTIQSGAGLEALNAAPLTQNPPQPAFSYVGPYGAMLFGSALHRVAMVNNIPVGAPSWCHGSIRKRMAYLEQLGTDPAGTGRFDRVMRRLYLALLAALAVGVIWTFLAAA